MVGLVETEFQGRLRFRYDHRPDVTDNTSDTACAAPWTVAPATSRTAVRRSPSAALEVGVLLLELCAAAADWMEQLTLSPAELL